MKKDNFNVHKWNHRQKIAGIINEANMMAKKYLYQDFLLAHPYDDIYEKINDENNKFKIDGKEIWLNPEVEGDWEEIIGMSVEQLEDTYKLTPEIAKEVKNEFDKRIKQFKEKELNEDENNSIVKEKVKNFLNNEIFSLEGMDDIYKREKMLKDVNNTIEKEIDEFVRRKFREERYTRRY
jgi:hypothetical protein